MNSYKTMHIYGPCTFPKPFFQNVPYYNLEIGYKPLQQASGTQFKNVCNIRREIPFICDLHNALNSHDFYSIIKSFTKNRKILNEENGTYLFGILVVRYLIQPLSDEYVTRNNLEFECLFRIPCQQMTKNLINNFVKNVKAFTKLYTAALFTRWFQKRNHNSINETCKHPPRVMILILLEGLVTTPKKLTTVNLYTDDQLLMPFIANIQFETTNLILQGFPLPDVIADLINQLGYAFKDFYSTMGKPRQHNIPIWAWNLVAICIFLAIFALFIEWFVVQKKFTKNRYISGPINDSLRSKTHIIF